MKAIIVGSGAGGSTVAKELSGRGIDVTLMEKGLKIAEKEAFYAMRTLVPKLRFSEPYVWLALPQCQSAGNGVRALEKELGVFGIDLSNEFEAAEKNGRAWAKRFT